jgi:hypothetical protein
VDINNKIAKISKVSFISDDEDWCYNTNKLVAGSINFFRLLQSLVFLS